MHRPLGDAPRRAKEFEGSEDADNSEVMPKPGGVVVIFPCGSATSSTGGASALASRGLFGVCTYDTHSRAVRCCTVTEPFTPETFMDLAEDAAEEEEHNEPSEVSAADLPSVAATDAAAMEDDDPLAPAVSGDADVSSMTTDRPCTSSHWLVQLLSSLSPKDTTLCRPVAPVPAHIEAILVEHVTRRGGSMKLYHGKTHNSLDGLLAQLSAMWPNVTASSWQCRLSLVESRSGESPVANTPLVTALSVMLDVLVRTGQRVSDIREEPAASFVHMDAATLHALRVFRSDAHPCGYQGIGGGYKEGFSLFSYFAAHTTTALGRDLLRRWMLSPTNSVPELQRRQGFIGLLGAPQCGDVVKALRAALKHLKHPGRTMFRFETLRHNRSDYVDLVRAASSLASIKAQILQLGDIAAASPELSASVLHTIRRWLSSIDEDAVAGLVSTIRNSVSLAPPVSGSSGTASSSARTGAASCAAPPVLPGVDAELDELRMHYARLGPCLTQVAEDLALSLPQDAYASWKLSCVFYPRVGYLIGVGCDRDDPRRRDGEEVGGLVPSSATLPHGWELVFEAPRVLYCRNPQMKELDRAVGDIHSAVIRRECDIRLRIDERILDLAPCVMPLLQVGAELDVLLAMSSVCCGGATVPSHTGGGGSEGMWCCPQFAQDPSHGLEGCAAISIQHAYHPLLSRLCGSSSSAVVPMPEPFHAHAQEGRLTIFTGPNGSGKSIAIQAILLSVYLAHIGAYVPASLCTLSTVDRIVFISDCASSSWGHQPKGSNAATAAAVAVASLHDACGGSSTFAQELLAVSRVLTQCTARSFIGLDEFGRGTLAADGIALLASFLLSSVVDAEQLLMRRQHHMSGSESMPLPPLSPPVASSPVILLATHYTEILAPRIGLMSSPLVQHARMAFLLPTTVAPSSESAGAALTTELPLPQHMSTSIIESGNDNGQGWLHSLDNRPQSYATDLDGAVDAQRGATGAVFPFRFTIEVGGLAGSAGKERRASDHHSSLALNCAAVCEVPEYMLLRMAALLEESDADDDNAADIRQATTARGTSFDDDLQAAASNLVDLLCSKGITTTTTNGATDDNGGSNSVYAMVDQRLAAWLSRMDDDVEHRSRCL